MITATTVSIAKDELLAAFVGLPEGAALSLASIPKGAHILTTPEDLAHQFACSDRIEISYLHDDGGEPTKVGFAIGGLKAWTAPS